jgi:hypothetical protein
MTITPQQAMNLSGDERVKIRDLEKKIDKALTREFGKHSSSVYVSTEYMDGRVRAEIERRYWEAGWNVTYESDQRDGDYLRFTARAAAIDCLGR